MRSAESPDLLEDDLVDFAAPSAFYSNQSGILGRVRWKGQIPLESIIGQLNLKLQYSGETDREFDFREAYLNYEFRYQIIETIGPTDTVVEDIREKNGVRF